MTRFKGCNTSKSITLLSVSAFSWPLWRRGDPSKKIPHYRTSVDPGTESGVKLFYGTFLKMIQEIFASVYNMDVCKPGKMGIFLHKAEYIFILLFLRCGAGPHWFQTSWDGLWKFGRTLPLTCKLINADLCAEMSVRPMLWRMLVTICPESDEDGFNGDPPAMRWRWGCTGFSTAGHQQQQMVQKKPCCLRSHETK